MKAYLGTLAVLLLLTCSATSGQQDAERQASIVLSDGSTLVGRLQQFDGRSYTIQTPSLGSVTVAADRVRTIRFGAEAATSPATGQPADGGLLQSQIQAMQKSVAQNPRAMGSIMQLQSNPKVQEILADPDLMAAINSGNLLRLMNDPRLYRLMEDPQMQAVIRSLMP